MDQISTSAKYYIHIITQIPCVLGSGSNADIIHTKDKKGLIGKTIDIGTNYCNLSEINDYCVRSKLVIEKCKRMYT